MILNGQSGERLRVTRAAAAGFPDRDRSLPLTGGMSDRGGQVVDHRVEHRLHTLVLERGTRHSIGVISCAMVRGAQRRLDLGFRQQARFPGTCSSALRWPSAAASTIFLAPFGAKFPSGPAEISANSNFMP